MGRLRPICPTELALNKEVRHFSSWPAICSKKKKTTVKKKTTKEEHSPFVLVQSS